MEQIKRNTTEFKAVKEAIDDYANKKTRKKYIRLYSLKPSMTVDEKVLINDLKENVDVIYDLNYEQIADYLRDRTKKLFRDPKSPFYVFKTSAKSKWMEFPFEFTGKLKKQVFPLKRVK